MCDTIFAAPASTRNGSALFGKNSDRQRNEAQGVELNRGAVHEVGALLQCTYIKIPQVRRTRDVLLSRPFWMWGAEMGANEDGVVIGNEGLTSVVASPQEPALTGMDLVRLALERSSSASEAVYCIGQLLQAHGQGGNCGHSTPSYYHNGFLIADSNEAFVMETVGREWVLQRANGSSAISNSYSIGRSPDAISKDMAALMREIQPDFKGVPEYGDLLGDPTHQHIGSAVLRRGRALELLNANDGRIGIAHICQILRDHGVPEEDANWQPRDSARRSICAHGAFDFLSSTTASLVSDLRPDGPVHWVTATSSPCLSIFKPVLLDCEIPSHGPPPIDTFDPASLWWHHERIHRTAMLGDFVGFNEAIRRERDELERSFQEAIDLALLSNNRSQRQRVVDECWRDALDAEARWSVRVDEFRCRETRYCLEWDRASRAVGLDLLP